MIETPFLSYIATLKHNRISKIPVCVNKRLAEVTNEPDGDLEEFEERASVGGHHLQQHVELLALSGLAVGGAQGER